MEKETIGADLYGTARDYGTENMQKHILSILKLFHHDCEKNKIKYSLNSGSCLGAVRHNGFIPWDDDADVMMTRKDFERYLEIAQGSDEYEIIRNLWIYRIKEKNSSLSATLDIFVIDNVPDHAFMRAIKLFLIKMLQGMMKTSDNNSHFSFGYRICLMITRLIGLPFSDARKFRLYESISKIGNRKETRYVGIYNNSFRAIARLYDRDLMDGVTLHAFEDTKLYITKQYDKYLKSVYGDYMTPPSFDQRKSGSFEICCNGEQVMITDSKHM